MQAITVYRTNRPEDSRLREKPEDFADVEYYEIALNEQDDEFGIARPTLRVFHGWWDESQEKARNNFLILRIPYTSEDDADAAFEKQLAYYAAQGFIHSFTPTPWGPYRTTLV